MKTLTNALLAALLASVAFVLLVPTARSGPQAGTPTHEQVCAGYSGVLHVGGPADIVPWHGQSVGDLGLPSEGGAGDGSVGSLPLTILRFGDGSSLAVSAGRIVGGSAVLSRGPNAPLASQGVGGPGSAWSPISWDADGPTTTIHWAWWSRGIWYDWTLTRGPSMTDKQWRAYQKAEMESARELAPPDDPQPAPPK